jgi:hypothetical protein
MGFQVLIHPVLAGRFWPKKNTGRTDMKNLDTGFVVAAGFLLAACGKPGLIDTAKKAHLSECPDHEIGRIVNGYYQSTNWKAYATDTASVKRITAEGGINYVGRNIQAELEFLFDEETSRATLQTVRFDGEEQLRPFAEALVSNMCDAAGK